MKSLQEIAMNYVWLKPVFPDTVPGAVVLTDIWLYLDNLFERRLLSKRDEPKELQAATEANRVKRLCSALRYLYRNSV